MPGHIQLVMIPQVGEALIQPIDDIICIQIAVRLLGFPGQGDHRVRLGFQPIIPLCGQSICHALNPFPQIAVLKHAADKRALCLPCRHAQIGDAAAGWNIRDAIIQCIPHIRNGNVAHLQDAAGEKRIRDLKLLQRHRMVHGPSSRLFFSFSL